MVTGTLESILENATHWSTHSMAWAEGLTQNAVLRIWQAFGLKPHLQETFKLSTARLDVHLVMDNYATHKTPKVAA